MSLLEPVIVVIFITVAFTSGQESPVPDGNGGSSGGSANPGQDDLHGDLSALYGRGSGHSTKSGSGNRPASAGSREGASSRGGVKANKAQINILNQSCFVMVKKDYPAPSTCRDEVVAAVLSTCPDDELRYEMDPSFSCLSMFQKQAVYQWNPSCNSAPAVQTGWIKVYHRPTKAVIFQDNITLDTSGLPCRKTITASISFSNDDLRQ